MTIPQRQETNILRQSVTIIRDSEPKDKGISLTNKMNNKGPRLEPQGKSELHCRKRRTGDLTNVIPTNQKPFSLIKHFRLDNWHKLYEIAMAQNGVPFTHKSMLGRWYVTHTERFREQTKSTNSITGCSYFFDSLVYF